MIDIYIPGISRLTLLFNSTLYLFILLKYWNFRRIKSDNGDSKMLFLLVCLFAVCSFYNGDYFHYEQVVRNVLPFSERFGLEDFYGYLINFTHHNYLLFRIVVWGGALLLVVFIAKLYDASIYGVIYFLFALYMSTFDYSRASLGMAVYFMGLSVFTNKTNVILKLLGLVVIVSSYFFHRSMAILIVLTVFIYIPINRYTFFAYFLITLVFLSVFKGYFLQLMDTLLNSDVRGLSNRIDLYMQLERSSLSSSSLLGTIVSLWSYFIYYYVFIVDSIYIIKNRHLISHGISKLYNVTFALVLFATFMLFSGLGALAFFYRYLFMSIIPLSVLSIYMFRKGIMPLKSLKKQFYVGSGYLIFSFLYRLLIVGH